MHIRDKYPAEISGGEKQRTAVARALINQPLMILADEPTGNLDSKSSRTVIDSFLQARQARDATILMVTHDSYAASFCDRVVGRLIDRISQFIFIRCGGRRNCIRCGVECNRMRSSMQCVKWERLPRQGLACPEGSDRS